MKPLKNLFKTAMAWTLSLQICFIPHLHAITENRSETTGSVFKKTLQLAKAPENNIEIEIFQNSPPQAIIDEVNNTPHSELVYISANSDDPETGPHIDVHSGGKANFPKNWWVVHNKQLQTVWCLIRYTAATGAFYMGLISFSQFSLPTIIAGAQLAGLMSLLFMYNNININEWLTTNKFWGYRLVRYYFLSVIYLSVVKFGIIDAEMFLRGSIFIQSVDKSFLIKEFSTIAYSALLGTATQGFWGLWNAQIQENKLNAIDRNLSIEEHSYRREVVKTQSNFISFVNSIINNSLSSLIATGGDMLILDVTSYLISASGIVAFAHSYPHRKVKCQNLF